MDWFLYDNGLRHERVNNLTDHFTTNVKLFADDISFFCSLQSKYICN